jgi:hypothetical protein
MRFTTGLIIGATITLLWVVFTLGKSWEAGTITINETEKKK